MRALLVCDRSTLRSSGSHDTFCAPPRLLARASAKTFTISDGLTKRIARLNLRCMSRKRVQILHVGTEPDPVSLPLRI